MYPHVKLVRECQKHLWSVHDGGRHNFNAAFECQPDEATTCSILHREASKALSPAQKAHVVSGIYRTRKGQEQHQLCRESSQQLPCTLYSTASSTPAVPGSRGSQAVASSLSQHASNATMVGNLMHRPCVESPGQRTRLGKASVPAWASERQRLLSASGLKEPGTSLLLHQSWGDAEADTVEPSGGQQGEGRSVSCGGGVDSMHGHNAHQCPPETRRSDTGDNNIARQRCAGAFRKCLHSCLRQQSQ